MRKLSKVGVRKVGDLQDRLRAGDLNELLKQHGLRLFSAETLARFWASTPSSSAPSSRSPAPPQSRPALSLEPQSAAGGGGRHQQQQPQASSPRRIAVPAKPTEPSHPLESPEATAGLPMAASPPEADKATECVICYEPVRHIAELPCACKVDYCMQCWDRALTQSFQKCNMARCPTCRSPVRVDFSHREDRLVFSRETEFLQAEGEASFRAADDYFERTLTRITDQVRPAQIRLLKNYGAAYGAPWHGALDPPPRHGRDHGEGWSSSESSRSPLDNGERICIAVETCVAEGMEGPKCVCGGLLKRVAAETRMVQSLQERVLEPADTMSEIGRVFMEIIQRERGRLTGIICDLCEGEVPSSSAVWMCENGDRTIKHATEYDICDACFANCVS